MKSRVRTVRLGAATLLIGALASSVVVMGAATSAVAAPAKATNTSVSATALSPQVCRYGCL